MKMRCPICNGEYDTHTTDTQDGHILLEEDKRCEGCSYHYFYAYGNSRTSVGRVCVEESYTDSEEVSALKAKIIEMAIQIIKEEQK